MASKQWLPWKQLLGFGLSHLKLSPAELWKTTPREMDAAIDACLGPQRDNVRPSRAAMEQLMSIFPDDKRSQKHE